MTVALDETLEAFGFLFGALTFDQVRYLSEVVGHLTGSYTEEGIRRWWVRPRSAGLAGLAPIDLFEKGWRPGDTGPARVLALAAQQSGNHT